MVASGWGAAREGVLLDPTVVNLNTGSCGPLPRTVFDRVTDLRAHLARAPMDFLLRRVPGLLWEARARLAAFLGGDPHRLAFTTNVTGAVNLVATALPLAGPGEVLLSDHEYAPMRRCWERAARRQGLTVREFELPARPSDPAEVVEAAVAAMTPGTRLLFLSHVVSSTGVVLPIAELCEQARRRGITTVVDGAQAPAFTDVDLASIPCDFYAGSGHKWLLAPTGTGFLHFGADERTGASTARLLRPTQVSWGFEPPASAGPPDGRDRFGSTPRLREFECEGTRDITPWLAVPAALDFHAGLGPDRIRARRGELVAFTRERLTGWRGLEPVTPDHPALSGAMTAFRLPEGTDGAQLHRGLWEGFRVEVPVVERPGQALLRVSTNFYNTEAEVERLAEALKELVRA
jgi:isopenicillin-N epimerase